MITLVPKIGDEVQVAYTGKVHRAGTRFIQITDPDGLVNRHKLYGGVSMVFTRPEPEYEDREMYVDADGDRYEFEAESPFGPDRWWETGNNRPVDFSEPTRPLRRLVPEGGA